jgi:hypothetical protein
MRFIKLLAIESIEDLPCIASQSEGDGHPTKAFLEVMNIKLDSIRPL